MTTYLGELNVKTEEQVSSVSLTKRLNDLLTESNVGGTSGLVTILLPHTTATLILNSNVADGTTLTDIRLFIERTVPVDTPFVHRDPASDAAAHVRCLFGNNSVTLPLDDGRLALGTWQDLHLLDFDGPRDRTVRVWLSS